MNIQRLLITTADERSWKFDRPVLFLGEWCRLYDRKNIWSKMDTKVAEPFGLGREQKEKDRLYTYSLSVQLLEELTNALNRLHHTRHDTRYWNIVLGHWLQRYVSVAFNRYFSLEKALKENNVSGTVAFNLPDYKLATSNSIDFIWALYDNVWNHIFYTRALEYFGNVEQELIDFPQNYSNYFNQVGIMKPEPILKTYIRDLSNKVMRVFCRNDDALIIKSYLPFFYAFQLQLNLGQCPVFWNTSEIQKIPYNSETRKDFKIDAVNFTGFEHFIRSLLSEVIPTCYLEGFSQLVQQSQLLPWPRNPKFIFTSNNFDTDEIFKIWTAQKVEEGYKYYIGQHGANYGTWINHNCLPELITPDKFISWGWKTEEKKVLPAYIFTTLGRKKRKNFTNDGLLLIELCLHSSRTTYDCYYEHIIYQEEQFRFVASLTKNVQEKLTVRLHRHKPSNIVWSDEQRWIDYNSSIKLELGLANIWDLINENRLVVFSFDSTGFLETLALNIPTIGFWNGLFEEITPCAKPYYELLRDAGILAETPEEASKLINLYWDNLDEWWFSANVQLARKTFCDHYAKKIEHPVHELKKILTSDIS